MATTNSYWCYTCNRFVRIRTEALTCPHCTGGFVEQMAEPAQRPTEFLRRRGLPRSEARRLRRPTFSQAGGPTSPFNPVIVLRRNRPDTTGTNNNNFELYYADGAGRGLHPLPDSMSDFLMGTGFERLLDQLSQIEATGLGRALTDHPAAKSAVDSMPIVEIEPTHIGSDSHCAVCKDPFELGSEAREMPCKHIYHEDCILPWLSSNNSCPVCRHQMPTDGVRRGDQGNGDEMVGLTIWRLPGGGFAVGRFAGVERGVGGDRELPVVYTEVDGGIAGFNNNNNDGAAREIAWTTRMAGSRQRNGFSSFIQRVFGCFGPSSSNSDANSNAAVSSSSSAGNYLSSNSNAYRRNGRNIRDPGSMSS